MRILLLNGPNLNLLGLRVPDVYGATTLGEVEDMCRVRAVELGHGLECYQSNHEGALIDAIHAARDTADGLVFNPGAYTHTSYALHDAIEAAEIPTVEIHISNVREREPWRRISVTEPACIYQIFGRGVAGYLAAIDHLHYWAALPAITLAYGKHPDQVGDLRLPDGPGPHPVTVLIHGGGWAAPYTRDQLDGIAVDLAGRGEATWNIEYRRIPPVGGWRETMADALAALDHLEEIAGRFTLDLDRVTVLGHSAGSQLGFSAATSAARPPIRFVSLAGMLDLRRLGKDFDELLSRFLGHDPRSLPDSVDPIRNLPGGVPIVAVHGDRDGQVSLEQSSRFVEAARSSGTPAELRQVRGAVHQDLVDPRAPAWQEVAAALWPG